jgi:hypothetical protein
MATIKVSDELLAELQEKAAAEGCSIDELANIALKKGLEERAWDDLTEYGRQTGAASGYQESDVPDVIRKRRQIMNGR